MYHWPIADLSGFLLSAPLLPPISDLAIQPCFWPVLLSMLLNITAFYLMALDKARARTRKRRVPERVFFLLALAGATPGVLAGMYVFRHKTRHRSFFLGVPVILFVQILAFVCFVIR